MNAFVGGLCMKRTLLKSRYIKDFAVILRKNIKFFSLLFLFIGSVAAGVLLIRGLPAELTERISSLVRPFLLRRTSQSFFHTFWYSLLSCLPFVIAAFFLGFSSIGSPFLAAIPVVNGLGIGIVAGYLYSFEALKGVIYCVLMILPSSAISTLALLLMCRESIHLSMCFAKLLFPAQKQQDIHGELKAFLKRYTFFFAIILLSALVDAVLSSGFSKFFIF